MISSRAQRIESASVVGLTILVGLWVRSSTFPGPESWSQHLGTALWAVALYWAIRVVAPGWTVKRLACVTLLIAWSVELLQLTPIPRTLWSWHPAFGLLFGRVFDPADVLMLSVGVGVAGLLHGLRIHARSGVHQGRIDPS